jgi:hypothetical protein
MTTCKSWNCAIAYRVLLILFVVAISPVRSAYPQNVGTHEDAARAVSVEKIAVNDGRVSGEVLNRSSRVLRDVQLFIRYTWLWDNETKPGSRDPGMSAYYTVPGEIPPRGYLPFSFQPSPSLPKVSGGHFESSVSVAGYTEVIPQTK